MLTREENELLTRVTGDAPMGRMIRQHWWIPVVRSEALVPDGKPERVRALGENYVVFRATDGRLGMFDEACPHRGASLALARNEDNALRCIYHGWQFHVDGSTVAVPTQPQREAEYCKQVPLASYPLREAGGMVWAWLGSGGEPPKFPDYPFVGLPVEQCTVHRQRIECNWVQGVETTMDSAHVGVLHQSFLIHDIANAARNQAPVYHVAPKDYGFRYAAVRALGEGRAYVRTNSFVAPFFSFISPRKADEKTRGQMFFSVPIDDDNIWYWHLSYVTDGKVPYDSYLYPSDRDNWPPVPSRSGDDNWGQDRTAMKQGHFSGFPQSLGTEDFAIILSQGTVVDRTKEFLGAGDGAVVQVRRCLLGAVREFIDGKTPALARHEAIDYRRAHPVSGVFENEAQWRASL